MSHAMWVLVALVVALVIALLMILIFRSSSDKAGKQGTDAIGGGGKGANLEICNARCETCRRLGTSCDWSTYGADCPEIACTT